VLRSVGDVPEYVRLETIMGDRVRTTNSSGGFTTSSAARETFFESQRATLKYITVLTERVQRMRMQLAQVRLRFRDGGDAAAVRVATAQQMVVDDRGESSNHSLMEAMTAARGGGGGDTTTTTISFNPEEHCPLVKGIDDLMEAVTRHLNERFTETSTAAQKEGHEGRGVQRIRLLTECGLEAEARAICAFIARRAKDPTLPVPEVGPVSYIRTSIYVRTRLLNTLEHIKQVLLHVHHKDADDYARIGLKMIRIIEAMFMGVKEVWSTLKYVPLRDVMMAFDDGV